MRFENFARETYLDVLASFEDCLNFFYPELVESAAGTDRNFRRTPGLSVFATLPKAVSFHPSLTRSDDGGQTFSNPVTVTIQPKNFLFPVEWGGAMTGQLRMSPRGRIYNFTITDAVDCEIIDADLELSPGRH